MSLSVGLLRKNGIVTITMLCMLVGPIIMQPAAVRDAAVAVGSPPHSMGSPLLSPRAQEDGCDADCQDWFDMLMASIFQDDGDIQEPPPSYWAENVVGPEMGPDAGSEMDGDDDFSIFDLRDDFEMEGM